MWTLHVELIIQTSLSESSKLTSHRVPSMNSLWKRHVLSWNSITRRHCIIATFQLRKTDPYATLFSWDPCSLKEVDSFLSRWTKTLYRLAHSILVSLRKPTLVLDSTIRVLALAAFATFPEPSTTKREKKKKVLSTPLPQPMTLERATGS